MDITKLDITIIIAATTAVILMSLTFPAIGLAGDEAERSSVPEFNVSGDRFNLAGEFPEQPGTPSEGQLDWAEDGSEDTQMWLRGDTNGGEQFRVINDGTTENPEVRYQIDQWDAGAVVESDNETFTEPGDGTLVLSDPGWVIRIEATEFNNVNTSDFRVEGEYEIREQPSSDSWYQRIPVIGSAINAGANLTGIVSWIGSIVRWAFMSLWEIVLNTIGVVFDFVLFCFGVVAYMFTTYNTIAMSPSAAWATAILYLPALMLMMMWAKLAMLTVEVVWIG